MLSVCLSRFDENLNNVLEPEHAATDVKMDSRLQRTNIMPLTFWQCLITWSQGLKIHCVEAVMQAVMLFLTV